MEAFTHVWKWVVLRGIVAILVGTLTLFYPGITLAALVLLFGAYAFVDGILTIVWAVRQRHGESHWVSPVVSGVLGMGVGLVTLLMPAISALALLLLIAAWAIVTGVATIIGALRLRRVVTGEWRLVLMGLLAVALGVILIARPLTGALAMVLWIGAYADVSGVLLVALGFRLRAWGRVHPAGVTPRPI